MTIEWFPGHMATARRHAVETMRATDVVIEVLDARVPFSSCSPMVETLRRENSRPALKLLNKVDVADARETERWLAHYNAQPQTRAIALSSRKAADVRRIPKECALLAPGRGTGIKPLRMMILGIPNVGKSTLMNALLNRHVAKVGDEPAITKNQMKHALGPHQWIVDTPGMLWPGLDQAVALKLAATNSIGRNAYDEVTVAVDFGERALRSYPGLLAARFGPLPTPCSGEALLAHIAAARHIAVDAVPKAAAVLLNDFRSGALGRMTLETVDEAITTSR
ncbi:MAG: ribosome biogenesis GTPase YlqF [Deltaproteobacteria bacterium]|nr:ribosome biogenesis GTPase YlqF [Deltaproteobacteria bacterium]